MAYDDQKWRLQASIGDTQVALSSLRVRLNKLIDRCEFENRYPSIQELRDLKEHIDDAQTFIIRAHKIING